MKLWPLFSNLFSPQKRNIEKFPEDFMFQLDKQEIVRLSRCQDVTSIQTESVKEERRYKPFVFEKQVINMVATILKQDVRHRSNA